MIGQPRATQRQRPIIRDDEETLTAAIIRLATTYGRYACPGLDPGAIAGSPRCFALKAGGANLKWVYRIWRREGLKVPQKQPKRGRLWLNDGSCIRLRPERAGHVWCYDFVQSLPSRRRGTRRKTAGRSVC